MSKNNFQKWLEWTREIQQLCQTGLAFSESQYDTDRYNRLLEIAAEITATHTDADKEDLLEIFNSQLGYATPKVDIRAAIIMENSILLVQEKMDNKWSMPGGWADVGESPSQAVVRETQEETGLTVKPIKIIGVYDANRDGRPLEFFHAYKIVFQCKVIGGSITTSSETIDVKYFDLDELPPLSTSRTNQKHIIDIKKIIKDPAEPTTFQ